MARRRTGTVVRDGEHWKVRVRLNDGRRPWIHLDAGVSETDAIRLARKWSAQAKRGELQLDGEGNATPAGETVRQWCERWLVARERSGIASVRNDRFRLGTHVFPSIGDRPIRDVTSAELRALVARLDARVVAGEISWATARHGWTITRAMFRDAASSKDDRLRVREDVPTAGVRAPDIGARKAKVYLYPSEFLQLVSCETVPLRWRRVFALAVYLYVRPGELDALDWSAVDLDHGTVHVHRSVDYDTGRIVPTKTQMARRFAFEPTLSPLLRVLHAETGGVGRVVKMPPPEELASFMRRYLQRAGVTRSELFEASATHKRITFYDLRATGITWAAIRGDELSKLQRRAGHTTPTTTDIYIREGENVADGFGTPFPPLPASLMGATTPAGAQVPETSSNGLANGPPAIASTRKASPPRAVAVASPGGFEAGIAGNDVRKHVAIRPNEDAGDDANPAKRGAPDHSRTNELGTRATTPNPRDALTIALATVVRDATLAGDHGAARIALDALGKLVRDLEAGAGGASVIDLEAKRRDRT